MKPENKKMDINVEAIMSMEQMARQILLLSEEARNEFYEILLQNGLNEEDVNTIKKCVGFYHLMTDESCYKAVRTAVCDSLYNAFRNE